MYSSSVSRPDVHWFYMWRKVDKWYGVGHIIGKTLETKY
ncbi:MAG: hypothetical protein ACI9QA_000494, partial [Methanobacteriota archaeon]